jgi:hypothetical protein
MKKKVYINNPLKEYQTERKPLNDHLLQQTDLSGCPTPPCGTQFRIISEHPSLPCPFLPTACHPPSTKTTPGKEFHIITPLLERETAGEKRGGSKGDRERGQDIHTYNHEL